MKRVLALMLLFLAPSLASSDQNTPASRPMAPVLHPWVLPIGSLGFPLGTYLTIEGQRAEGIKLGIRSLGIYTINGKRLERPIGIWVDNVESPPAQVPLRAQGL